MEDYNRPRAGTNLATDETTARARKMSVFGARLCTGQSVPSSQSKHVSAVRNSLHNEVSQPCNTVPAFWGTAGGSGPSQQRRGKAASSLAQDWPETSSHF